MPRKRGDRLYKKDRRWYADFRDFRDVGGRREALIRRGEPYATKGAVNLRPRWSESVDANEQDQLPRLPVPS